MQKRLFSKNLFVLAFVSVLLVILTVMTGCSSDTLSATEEKKESKTENPVVEQKDVVVDEKEGWPEKFVYGILPSEDQSVMSRRYEPFQAYLEKELGMPVEFFFGTDYTAIIEALRNNHIHASHFGPFSYTLAAERANAEAFSMGVKSVEDATYTSVIVTLEGSGIETLQDLEGKNMAWVDAASTSGHLFPKALLINELGKTLDEVDAMFANATFAGGHDAALLSVLNGDTDAAGVGDFIIDTIQESHKDHPNIEKIKIIAVTDDIPRGPDAISKELPESFRVAVKKAFLDAVNNPELSEFLETMNYQGGFIDVKDSQYDVIRMTADALGLSPEELLK